jgi:subtilisin family serine protease
MSNPDSAPEFPPIEVPVEGQPQDAISEGPPFRVLEKDLIPDDVSRDPHVTVGIVDGKVWQHEEFKNSVSADDDDILRSQSELDTMTHDGLLDRQAGHATFIAGVVLQQSPGARIRLDHALDNLGTGRFEAVAAAVENLVKRHGAKVVNLSLGSRGREADWTALVDRLAADHPDVVVVVAAGNLTRNETGYREQPFPFFPAALGTDRPNVVTVGGARRVDVDGVHQWHPAEVSNCWPTLDFVAPAVDLTSTFVTFLSKTQDFKGYARWSGTSFAAAVVSGQVAATMQATGLTAPEAVEHLRNDTKQHVVIGGRPVPLLGENTRIWRPKVAP